MQPTYRDVEEDSPYRRCQRTANATIKVSEPHRVEPRSAAEAIVRETQRLDHTVSRHVKTGGARRTGPAGGHYSQVAQRAVAAAASTRPAPKNEV